MVYGLYVHVLLSGYNTYVQYMQAQCVCMLAWVHACVDHPRACLYSNIYTNQQCTQTFQLL